MKIAYNPSSIKLDNSKLNKNDILFDLNGLSIYAKGIQFKGTDTTYSVFKKHTSIKGGGHDGLVPVPSFITTNVRFLCENGTWTIPLGDHKVSLAETNVDSFRPLVLGAKYNSEPSKLGDPPVIDLVYTTTKIYVQPKKGHIYATSFIGNLEGNAKTATTATYVDWSGVKNPPKTYIPSPHNHSELKNWIENLTDNPLPNNYENTFKILGAKTNSQIELNLDKSNNSSVLIFDCGENVQMSHLLAFSDNGSLYKRIGQLTTWDPWSEILDSNTYTKYTVTKTGEGAEGIWDITASNSLKLGGIKASEYLLKSEELTNNLIELSVNLKLSTTWLDTGIILNTQTFPLGKGSYIVQISYDDLYIWTGYCTLNIGSKATVESSDEIMLHGGGFNIKSLPYLRTINDTDNNCIKILIAYTDNSLSTKTWKFKFKKII